MLAAGLEVGDTGRTRRRRATSRTTSPGRAAARAAATACSSRRSVQRRPGALERGGQLARRLADQVHGRRQCSATGRAGRVASALAPAAGDQVHAALEGREGHERRGHVGRLGVVDVEDAVALGHLLEAVGDAGEVRRPARTASGSTPAGQRDRGRGHRVAAVVRAPQRSSSTRSSGSSVPPQRAGAVSDSSASGRCRSTRAGRSRRGPRPRGPGVDGDVVVALAGEGLQLGGGVGVEGAVAVEVVLCRG